MRCQAKHLPVDVVDDLARQHEDDAREHEQQGSHEPTADQYLGERIEEVSRGVCHVICLFDIE